MSAPSAPPAPTRTTRDTVTMPEPASRMTFTGERYTTGVPGDIQNEHYHRYLFALRLCEGRDVLDVASGEGYGAALLAGVARSVVGVDLDYASVAFAAAAYPRANLGFRTGSVLALPLADAAVDVVTCFETLEHVSDHDALLREVRRVLRPGGVFVVSTPDREVYAYGGEGPSNPYHQRELNPGEFEGLLRQGFPFVRLYEQQVLAGSVLAARPGAAPDEDDPRATSSLEESSLAEITESFLAEPRAAGAPGRGRAFDRGPGLPRAPYLVAVAAAAPVALPALSLLHGLPTDATLAAPVPPPAEDLDALRAELSDLRERRAEADLRAERHAAERAEAELRAERHAAERGVEAERHAAERAEAELRAERHAAERLEADRERGYLRAMLGAARRVADLAREELAGADAAIREGLLRATGAAEATEAARAEAAAARAEVATARADAAEADGRVDRLLRSTSWRVTRPLRGLVRLARGDLGAARRAPGAR